MGHFLSFCERNSGNFRLKTFFKFPGKFGSTESPPKKNFVPIANDWGCDLGIISVRMSQFLLTSDIFYANFIQISTQKKKKLSEDLKRTFRNFKWH